MSEDMFIEDTFKEVTNESWQGRIGSAFKGIVIGLVLFMAAFPVLFWNEGRAVKRYKTLKEGAGIEKIPQTAKVAPDPVTAANLLNQGQNYFRNGQYEQAVMQFSRVIKSGDNRKVALYNHGAALFKLNKKEAALKDFKNAAKLGHAKAKAILNQITP